MKIKDAIAQMSKMNPEDCIVLAYWEKDMFPEVSDDDWPYACDMGNNMDWSRTHEAIQDTIHYALEENKEEPEDRTLMWPTKDE